MNDKQAWFLSQSNAFQEGFQDYRQGVPFCDLMSPEWMRGWRWASCNL